MVCESPLCVSAHATVRFIVWFHCSPGWWYILALQADGNLIHQNQWLHLLSKLSPGAKREGEGAPRRKSRNEGELRVAGSLSCEKTEWVRKWRGNCKELGHTCSGFKETGRDVGISVTPIGKRENRRGEGSLLVSQADRKGCENHSLGFQGSFMEAEWREVSEKAERVRLLR